MSLLSKFHRWAGDNFLMFNDVIFMDSNMVRFDSNAVINKSYDHGISSTNDNYIFDDSDDVTYHIRFNERFYMNSQDEYCYRSF